MDSVILWKEEPNSKSLEVSLISVVVQPLSQVWLFVTPCPAAFQTFLSFTISPSLLKFMSIEIISSISPYIQKGEGGKHYSIPERFLKGVQKLMQKIKDFTNAGLISFTHISSPFACAKVKQVVENDCVLLYPKSGIDSNSNHSSIWDIFAVANHNKPRHLVCTS